MGIWINLATERNELYPYMVGQRRKEGKNIFILSSTITTHPSQDGRMARQFYGIGTGYKAIYLWGPAFGSMMMRTSGRQHLLF